MQYYFTEDGTYGDASSLSVFNTENWTETDWQAIEESSDSDRVAIANRIERNTSKKKGTNTMTETQKLIATEVVKQRMKRVSSETLLNKRWPGFLASNLKRDIETTHAVEKVLSQLLHDVSRLNEGGKS